MLDMVKQDSEAWRRQVVEHALSKVRVHVSHVLPPSPFRSTVLDYGQSLTEEGLAVARQLELQALCAERDLQTLPPQNITLVVPRMADFGEVKKDWLEGERPLMLYDPGTTAFVLYDNSLSPTFVILHYVFVPVRLRRRGLGSWLVAKLQESDAQRRDIGTFAAQDDEARFLLANGFQMAGCVSRSRVAIRRNSLAFKRTRCECPSPLAIAEWTCKKRPAA